MKTNFLLIFFMEFFAFTFISLLDFSLHQQGFFDLHEIKTLRNFFVHSGLKLDLDCLRYFFSETHWGSLTRHQEETKNYTQTRCFIFNIDEKLLKKYQKNPPHDDLKLLSTHLSLMQLLEKYMNTNVAVQNDPNKTIKAIYFSIGLMIKIGECTSKS